jgi:hypothetical protein
MGHRSIGGLFILVMVVGNLWACGTPQSVRPVPGSPAPVVAQPSPSPLQPIPTPVKPVPAPTEPSLGSLAYLDFRNGFRDLKFGDPPTSDMVLKEEESGDTKYYARPRDDLSLGGAQLQRIIYGFYKDRFFWLLLETQGLVHSRAMLDVMRQAYGPGYQGNRYLQEFAWLGSHVSGLYNQNLVTSNARMILQSKAITAERESDQKAKARKGVSGL